jgi:hypothetical protein
MFKELFLTAVAVGLFSTFSLQLTPAEAVGMRGMTAKTPPWQSIRTTARRAVPGKGCAKKIGSNIRVERRLKLKEKGVLCGLLFPQAAAESVRSSMYARAGKVWLSLRARL